MILLPRQTAELPLTRFYLKGIVHRNGDAIRGFDALARGYLALGGRFSLSRSHERCSSNKSEIREITPDMRLARCAPGAVTAKRRSVEWFINAVALAAALAILAYFFRPELLLSKTTTTGGDTGAHIYLPFYLRNHLLPRGKIIGWSPDWYAGFPAFTFYFPLPALAIAVLSYAIPYQVAFKLIAAIGPFTLPIAVFAALRALNFDFPMPAMGALMTIPFMLMESFSINGGNILSTMAGEYGFSIAFSLSIISLALLCESARGRRSITSAGFALSLAALCHAVPAAVAVVSSAPAVANRDVLSRLRRLILALALAFGLTAFWSLPFVAKIGFTAGMVWKQSSIAANALPREIWGAAGLACVGAIAAVAKKDGRAAPFASLASISLTLSSYLPDGPIWRGRFLPFWYLSIFIFAAYGASALGKAASETFARRRSRNSAAFAVVILLACWSLIFPALRDSRVAKAWIEWNFSGYETKPSWKLYKKINDYMKSLPPGRIMWEFSPSYEKFGTTRAFEVIPFWTGKPTMEGTLIESSLTAPFHFINQAEISSKPTYALSGISYPRFDFERGIKHLKLYNVKYLLVSSSAARAWADYSKELKLLKKIGNFSIYELPSDGYVSIPKYKPLKGDEAAWRDASLAWYKDEDKLDVPIAFGDDSALSSLKRVGPDLKGFAKDPLKAKGAAQVIRLSDEELFFRTSAIGAPHLVKISYFPNWKAEGADGPFLTTPSIMMVVPRQSEVRLYYGKTPVDYAGEILTAAALLIFISTIRKNFQKRRLAQPSSREPMGAEFPSFPGTQRLRRSGWLRLLADGFHLSNEPRSDRST